MTPAPILALRLPDYFYFVFAVCVLISACIILFYAKRHPNPHFRPRKSDIGIVSLVLLFVSGGIAFMTAGAFDTDIDKEKIQKKHEDAVRMSKMKGTSVEEEAGLTAPGETNGGNGGPKNLLGEDALPDDVPEEVREAFGGGSLLD